MGLAKVKYKGFIAPLIIGLLIWFTAPVRPAGVSVAAWHMMAIFIATIACLHYAAAANCCRNADRLYCHGTDQAGTNGRCIDGLQQFFFLADCHGLYVGTGDH
jgi:hypothetical protein